MSTMDPTQATTNATTQPVKDKPSETVEPNDEATTTEKGCCRWARYEGNATAQAYSVHGIGRGPIYLATVFLSTALIYLAADEVGCVEVNQETGEKEIIEDCDARVYGAFSPAALVTNIATISGILIALFLPMIGAIIDFTPHRWTVGVVSAVLMIMTEVVQIFTTETSWFAMAIVEAISGLIFEIQVLASLAYLADIARAVGEETMNTNTAYFLMVEVGSQVVYTMVVVAIALAFGLGDLRTAQVGQVICAIVSGLGFYLAWRRFPTIPAKHKLLEELQDEEKEEGANDKNNKRPNLLVAGFVQNWRTFQKINRDHKRSIRWFLLAVIFADSAANAFVTVAVIFLTEHLGLNTTEVGIFFIISLIAITLACRGGEAITYWTNPSVSWRLSMVYTFALTFIGALTLNRDNANPYSYVWGFCTNLGIGWYYQTQYLYMSMITPKDQEAEFAGFFNYCRLILVWLPPLMFSLMVEADVSQSIGVIVTVTFFLIATAVLSMSAPWEEVLQEVHKQDAAEPTEANNDGLAVEEDLSKASAELEEDKA